MYVCMNKIINICYSTNIDSNTEWYMGWIKAYFFFLSFWEEIKAYLKLRYSTNFIFIKKPVNATMWSSVKGDGRISHKLKSKEDHNPNTCLILQVVMLSKAFVFFSLQVPAWFHINWDIQLISSSPFKTYAMIRFVKRSNKLFTGWFY